MSGSTPWRSTADRFVLMVRLTPKASRDAVDGIEHDPSHPNPGAGRPDRSSSRDADITVLKARVRAVPEKGKANAALEKLIAKWIGLPKSRVKVITGSKSRIKTLALEGDHDDLATRLKTALDQLN